MLAAAHIAQQIQSGSLSDQESLTISCPLSRGHQRHGEDAGRGGGEGPGCSQEGGRATGGAKTAGGGEEGQTRPHGGREGKSTADHQGQGKYTPLLTPLGIRLKEHRYK